MHRVVVDVPNIFWRTVSAHSGQYSGNSEEKAGLALHSCLVTLHKYYKKLQPDQLAVVFEGNNNWRKSYTSSENCVSKLGYKANRIKDPSMAHLFDVLNDFKTLAENHTSIVCLQNNLVEGDDLIGGFVQYYPGDKITILSGDKDFTQLLKHENVTLLNPDKDVERTCDDPLFFMFEKCIRGDGGDNVRSSYPNVRKKRLEKAWSDPYEMTLLMNETWTKYNPQTDENETFKVKDLFEENKLLMDLEAQPENIKLTIRDTIENAVNNVGKFNLFAFNKFLGQHDLKAIGKNSKQFVNMFTCAPVAQKGIIKF